VAVSDPDGVLATPLITLPRNKRDLARLAEIVVEYEVVEVVVGLPRHLSGGNGAATRAAEQYAERVRRRVAPVPVRLVDERLSTVAAVRGLRERGIRAREQRSVVDQAAAAFILQGWLDTGARTSE